MTLTTVKVQTRVRDELARLAADDLGGVTLNSAVEYLLTEHRKAQVLAAFDRLEVRTKGCADYEGELGERDGVAADCLDGEG
ncbi:hypothetical protein OHV05_36100 (plasmid) [Kitasatospora sp. NBC_00070]|uniref:hypothetical protein n=1 Tax=Kitasatospora sp. NBC_00070 TaxID=2975962 RepID=UPI003252AD53